MTTIVVFASSLSVAFMILIIKATELKTERKNFLLRILCRFDSFFHKFVSVVKFRALQTIQTIRFIFTVKTREFALRLYKKALEKLENEIKTRQDIFMGRRDISNKGAASFYLKKITEDKENFRKGKIADENLPT